MHGASWGPRSREMMLQVIVELREGDAQAFLRWTRTHYRKRLAHPEAVAPPALSDVWDPLSHESYDALPPELLAELLELRQTLGLSWVIIPLVIKFALFTSNNQFEPQCQKNKFNEYPNELWAFSAKT